MGTDASNRIELLAEDLVRKLEGIDEQQGLSVQDQQALIKLLDILGRRPDLLIRKKSLACWLETVAPVIQQFLLGVRCLAIGESTDRTPIPCDSCPKKGTEHEICARLEAYLPALYGGKLHGETTTGMDLDETNAEPCAPEHGDDDDNVKNSDRDNYRNIRRVPFLDPLEGYRRCWELLTPKQQEVVQLRLGEGKTGKEIAQVLGKAQSTVSKLLKKARETKEEHDARMRKEELMLLRESQAKISES